MAYTQAQLDAIEAAIASGELRVKYEDREVTYRSLDDMLSIREQIRNALGLGVKSNRTLLAFRKGHDDRSPEH